MHIQMSASEDYDADLAAAVAASIELQERAETTPIVSVDVVVAIPVDATGPSSQPGAVEVVPVTVLSEPPVVVQASLVRTLSTMRPVVRTTRDEGQRGIPCKKTARKWAKCLKRPCSALACVAPTC